MARSRSRRAEDAPVVGPLGDGRVHRRQVGRGQPRAVDEVDDEALVATCVEERAARRQPVATGAARLLVVLLRRGRERPVRRPSGRRPCRCPCRRRSSRTRRRGPARKAVRAAARRAPSEPGVVGGARSPPCAQRIGDLLARPPAAAVDDAGARRRVQQRAEQRAACGAVAGLRDGEHEVGAVKPVRGTTGSRSRSARAMSAAHPGVAVAVSAIVGGGPAARARRPSRR